VPKSKAKPYPKRLKELMAKKTKILSQARSLSEMGMVESAVPLWALAASHEERIAPILETLGRPLEAALHRVSAASCYEKAEDFTHAANLYRAALSGPLRKETHQEVQDLLSRCLAQLSRSLLVSTGAT